MRIRLLALFALLMVLALLQYRWIGRMEEAEGERMRTHLREGSENMAREVDDELARAYLSVLLPEQTCSTESYADRYQQWSANAKYPRIIRGISMATSDDDAVLRYDAASGKFVRGSWPAEWQGLKSKLPWSLPEPPATPEMQPGLLAAPQVMIAPCVEFPPRLKAWVIVELDGDYLISNLLPRLAARHLGQDYKFELAVAGSRRYDHVEPVVALRTENLRNLLLVRSAAGSQGRIGLVAHVAGGGDEAAIWKAGFTHRSGSVGDAVFASRMLNLGGSLGLLLLLAGGVFLVLRAAKEDQRLSEMRVSLIAGVSHELRTPVSVICSAADNLADGCVNSSAQAAMYGRLVRDEGRKLASMIDQMLEFAGLDAGERIKPRPVAVAAILDGALESMQQELARSKCEVSRDVEYGLPLVMGDVPSLVLCLKNLLTNALKYGGEQPVIELAATFIRREGKTAVCITVRDHGSGIPSEELVSVFDPFFRGGSAVGSQTHGIGLGLTLVKRIMEAHAGHVEVESKPGAGTVFSLVIPAASPE